MPDSASPADPATLLIPEAVCGACGYSLSGLSRHGRCPECGAPPWDTAQRGVLWTSSLTRVRDLYLGALIAELAPVAGVLGVIVYNTTRLDLGPGWVVFGLTVAAATGLGWWFLLSAGDRGPKDRPSPTLLVVGRGALCTVALGTLIAAALGLSKSHNAAILAVSIWTPVAAVLGGAVGLLALQCMRRAGTELRDEAIRTGAELVTWLALLGPAFLAVWAGLITLFNPAWTRTPVFEGMVALAVFCGTLQVGSCLIAYLGVLDRLRRLTGRIYHLRRRV